jgi:hypothetical protein
VRVEDTEIERLRRELAYYKDKQKCLHRVLIRWRDIAERWHGKYAIVKTENNALRRKLYQKEKREIVASMAPDATYTVHLGTAEEAP